jgi:hypothetical protein
MMAGCWITLFLTREASDCVEKVGAEGGNREERFKEEVAVG